MGDSKSASAEQIAEGVLEQTWEKYWFLPAASRSLAVVRIVTGILGLLLCATYGTDLSDWFGPQGWLPIDSIIAWRSSFAYSIFDVCERNTDLSVAFYGLVFIFTLLT
ncbi:MAG TPA: hypothetical protein DCR06_07560, partial [Planctomycetaceae bacterium]|nr:hypothetical protein [Planctomycetaceae bacterium]